MWHPTWHAPPHKKLLAPRDTHRYDIWQGHFKGGLAINDEHEALAVDGHPTPIAPAGGHRHLLQHQGQ
eukprot:1043324-Pelagomonas_calceolata.AAC.5